MSRTRNKYLESDSDEERDTVSGELNTPRYPGIKNATYTDTETGRHLQRLNKLEHNDDTGGAYSLNSEYTRESGIYAKRIDRPSGAYPADSRMTRETSGAYETNIKSQLPDIPFTRNGNFPPTTNWDNQGFIEDAKMEKFIDRYAERSPNDTLPWIRTAESSEFIHDYEFSKIAFANHRGSFRSNQSPFGNKSEDQDKITEFSQDSNDRNPKCYIATIAAIFLLIVVAAAVSIPLLIFSNGNKVSKDYAQVTVNVTFNNTYLPAYNNKSSPEYQKLTKDICDSMTDVYKQKDGKYNDRYTGCRVESVKPGSLVVAVVFYFIQASAISSADVIVILTQNVETALQATGLDVITDSITVIAVSTVSSVPNNAIILTTTTTTSTQATTGSAIMETTTAGSTTDQNITNPTITKAESTTTATETTATTEQTTTAEPTTTEPTTTTSEQSTTITEDTTTTEAATSPTGNPTTTQTETTSTPETTTTTAGITTAMEITSTPETTTTTAGITTAIETTSTPETTTTTAGITTAIETTSTPETTTTTAGITTAMETTSTPETTTTTAGITTAIETTSTPETTTTTAGITTAMETTSTPETTTTTAGITTAIETTSTPETTTTTAGITTAIETTSTPETTTTTAGITTAIETTSTPETTTTTAGITTAMETTSTETTTTITGETTTATESTTTTAAETTTATESTTTTAAETTTATESTTITAAETTTATESTTTTAAETTTATESTTTTEEKTTTATESTTSTAAETTTATKSTTTTATETTTTTATETTTTTAAETTTATESTTTTAAETTTATESTTTTEVETTTATESTTTTAAETTTATESTTTTAAETTTATESTTSAAETSTATESTTPTAAETSTATESTITTAAETTTATESTTSTAAETTTATESTTTTEVETTAYTDTGLDTPVVVMNDVTAGQGSDVTLPCYIYNAKNWTLVRILKKEETSGFSEILTWKPHETVNLVADEMQIISTDLSSSNSENFTVSVTFNSSSVCRMVGSYRCEVTSYGEIKNTSESNVIFKTTPYVDISVKSKYGQYVQSKESCTLQASEDNQDFGLYIHLPNEAAYQKYTPGFSNIGNLQTKIGNKDNITCLTNVTLTFIITAKYPDMDGASFKCNGTSSNGVDFTSNVVTVSVTPTKVTMEDTVQKDGEITTLVCKVQHPANWTDVKLIDVSGPKPNSVVLSAAKDTSPTISSEYIYDSNMTTYMNEDIMLTVFFNSSSVCKLEGEYKCVIELHGTEISSASAMITATADPSLMEISVTSSYSQNVPSVEYCSVVTAEFVPDFSVYIKKKDESGFTKISDQSINIISGIKKTFQLRVNETCSQNSSLTFTLTPTYPEMDGAEIKCMGSTVRGNQFTTSAKTITVQPAGVAFLNPTVLTYLDDGGSASITCAVRNLPNWNNIIIKHVAKGSVTQEIIANVTQSNDILVSNLVPRVEITTQKVTNISVKLVFTSVDCSDEGKYICEVTNDLDNKTAKDTMEFVLYRRPTLPALVLHIDQVEEFDRLGSEHKCFGNTGYPAGKMKLEYRTKDMDKFEVLAEPSSILRMLPNETGIGACKTNKTFTFGLEMPAEWNQAIIRCSIDNPLVLGDTGPLVVNDTIELILLSTCSDTIGKDVLKSSFYNCSRYTRCVSGVPYGKECETPGLVFGETETGIFSCANKEDVICEKDRTTTTTTTTTMAPNNADIQCGDKSAFIGNAIVIIECNVSITSDQNLTVSRGNQRLAFIDVTGQVMNDGVIDISVTFDTSVSPKVLQIHISNVKCTDEGIYTVSPSNGLSTRATLTLKEKPTVSPTLSIPIEIVEDEKWHGITCSGNVGYPLGRLKLEIKMPGNNTFEEVTANNTKNEKGNCTFYSTISLNLTRGMDMHGSLIRCNTENNETFESGDADVSSPEKRLYVIPKSVCENSTYDEYRNHPYDCNKYVRCLQVNTAVLACPVNYYISVPQKTCTDSIAECPANTVITTTTSAPTTTEKPPVMMMNDIIATNGKTFELKCIVYNAYQWTAVKLKDQINGEHSILTLAPEGSYTIDTNSYTSIITNVTYEISSENVTVSIFLLSNDVCKLEGMYKCVVEKNSQSYFKEANLVSTADPVFTSFPFSSAYEEHISSTESCTFNVSNDNVDVGLYLRLPGATEFTKSDWSVTTSKGQRDPNTCMFQFTLSFTVKPDVGLNGTELKCIASNLFGNISSVIRTLYVTLAGITFQDLEVSGFIDTDFIITTCILRNMGGWNTINITKESNVIFTISAGSATDGNLDTRIKQSFTDDGTEIRISLNYTNIICSDEGIYMCSVNKASVLYNATMKMSVKRRPALPELKLNVDQIENTDRLAAQHKCFGNTGYPAGQLKLEYLTKDMDKFEVLSEPSSVLHMLPIETGIGTCETNTTLTFRLIMPAEWDQAIIRCSVESPLVMENTELLAVNDTIELILLSTCSNTSGEVYKSNFYNCSRYTQCSVGLPYVRECLPGLLFGKNKVTGNLGTSCDFPNNVICEKDITTPSPMMTTTIAPDSEDISCDGAAAFIGDTTSLSCIFNSTSFNNITITRQVSGATQTVAYIQSDGSVQHQGIPNIQVTLDTTKQPKQLVISINAVECNDHGSYTVYLDQETKASANLAVKHKSLEHPSLLLGIKILENQQTDDITCSGNLGKPKGELRFEMKLPGESNFTVIPNITPTVAESTANCSTQQNATIRLNTQMSMNNSLIRCSMVNENTGQTGDNALLSNEETFLVVPQSACAGKTNSRIYHPYYCNRFLWCLPSAMYIQKCSSPSLCFDDGLQNCITSCSQCPSS